jgi:hypothetical protein
VRNFEMLEGFAQDWQATASARYPSLARFVSTQEPTSPVSVSRLLIEPVRAAVPSVPAT